MLQLFALVAFSDGNRFPPIARRKTRVNALVIESGAGLFLKMLSAFARLVERPRRGADLTGKRRQDAGVFYSAFNNLVL
jgi:hypothetical protein